MFVVRGPTTGTSTDGIWVDSIILPRFSESGTWKLRDVYLHDEVENLRHYRTAELSRLGFSRSIEVQATRDDVTAPELVELSLDPHEVDVSAGAATITVTVRVADDLSGTDRVQLDFVSPSGGQESTMFVVRGPKTGTSTDGIWVDSIILPRFSESGTWKLRDVYLHDEVENLRHYRSAELSGLGFSRSIEVKATQDDVTAPELVELSLDPHEVDVSAGAATITVTVRVTDDLSGTDRVQLDFVSPSGGQEATMFVVRGPTMGTSTDGIWVDSIILPRFSESGTWKLRDVYLHDEVENLRHYRSAELSGLGFSRSFEVVAKERQ